jgi:hypothetical protein
LFLNHGTRPTNTYFTTGGLAAKRKALFYYSGTIVLLRNDCGDGGCKEWRISVLDQFPMCDVEMLIGDLYEKVKTKYFPINIV